MIAALIVGGIAFLTALAAIPLASAADTADRILNEQDRDE